MFGASARFWLNLQIACNLRVATAAAGEQIERGVEPLRKEERFRAGRRAGTCALAAAVASHLASLKTRPKA